jgi:transcriptional regulator with XRE-family HTH domain
LGVPTISPAMTPQEEEFFRKFGERLSALRKEHGFTQVQTAAALGVSQQHLLSFEKGRRRMPMSMLPVLAELFSMSVDELIGTGRSPKKRGPVSKLEHQLKLLQRLPRAKQRFVSEMLDSVLQQTGS